MPIELLHRNIGRVNEYRTRLVADVVTGKLDVRGVELPAIDEAEEVDEWNEDLPVENDDFSDDQESEDAAVDE